MTLDELQRQAEKDLKMDNMYFKKHTARNIITTLKNIQSND